MSHAGSDSELVIAFGSPESPFPNGGGELPVFDLNSSGPLPDLAEVSQPAATKGGGAQPAPLRLQPADPESPPVARGEESVLREAGLWLDGDVLMCACPDCKAPMSIRTWLMIADCWYCGTSIELTEEQERAAERLLQRQAERRRAAPTAEAPRSTGARTTGARTRPATSSPTEAPRKRTSAVPAGIPTGRAGSPSPTPRGENRPTRRPPRPVGTRAPAVTGARARIRRLASRGSVHLWARDFFRDMPAWLVSLVLHVVVLTLLAILTIEDEQNDKYITLSTVVSREVNEGEPDNPLADDVQFDLPVPPEVNLDNPAQREAMLRADQDARELRVDPDAADPNYADLAEVKSLIASADRGSALAARDPRIRAELIRREGGTTLTEAAVARGLRWLAQHQHEDGRWRLNRFPNCNCDGAGRMQSDSAGTSLALLPYLGAGNTHLRGLYREEVAKGLRWLLSIQKPDGDLRHDSQGNSGMYAHGQGTIVLCEAYRMEGDEALRVPAQKAIDFIVAAQHPAGGWRYRPGEAGDTSVLGWQLMALQSGKWAGLTVPDTAFESAGHYLDSVQHRGGSQYGYQRGGQPTPAMTAEALLCRMYLGWTKSDPGLREGVDFLIRQHLPSNDQPNIYYWYYGTQTMHHAGGPQWEAWNQRMRDILVNSQTKQGHAAGSWPPRDSHSHTGGRIYTTSLAVCTLEVYYRHLPLFRQLDLESVGGK